MSVDELKPLIGFKRTLAEASTSAPPAPGGSSSSSASANSGTHELEPAVKRRQIGDESNGSASAPPADELTGLTDSLLSFGLPEIRAHAAAEALSGLLSASVSTCEASAERIVSLAIEGIALALLKSGAAQRLAAAGHRHASSHVVARCLCSFVECAAAQAPAEIQELDDSTAAAVVGALSRGRGHRESVLAACSCFAAPGMATKLALPDALPALLLTLKDYQADADVSRAALGAFDVLLDEAPAAEQAKLLSRLAPLLKAAVEAHCLDRQLLLQCTKVLQKSATPPFSTAAGGAHILATAGWPALLEAVQAHHAADEGLAAAVVSMLCALSCWPAVTKFFAADLMASAAMDAMARFGASESVLCGSCTTLENLAISKLLSPQQLVRAANALSMVLQSCLLVRCVDCSLKALINVQRLLRAVADAPGRDDRIPCRAVMAAMSRFSSIQAIVRLSCAYLAIFTNAVAPRTDSDTLFALDVGRAAITAIDSHIGDETTCTHLCNALWDLCYCEATQASVLAAGLLPAIVTVAKKHSRTSAIADAISNCVLLLCPAWFNDDADATERLLTLVSSGAVKAMLQVLTGAASAAPFVSGVRAIERLTQCHQLRPPLAQMGVGDALVRALSLACFAPATLPGEAKLMHEIAVRSCTGIGNLMLDEQPDVVRALQKAGAAQALIDVLSCGTLHGDESMILSATVLVNKLLTLPGTAASDAARILRPSAAAVLSECVGLASVATDAAVGNDIAQTCCASLAALTQFPERRSTVVAAGGGGLLMAIALQSGLRASTAASTCTALGKLAGCAAGLSLFNQCVSKGSAAAAVIQLLTMHGDNEPAFREGVLAVGRMVVSQAGAGSHTAPSTGVTCAGANLDTTACVKVIQQALQAREVGGYAFSHHNVDAALSLALGVLEQVPEADAGAASTCIALRRLHSARLPEAQRLLAAVQWHAARGSVPELRVAAALATAPLATDWRDAVHLAAMSGSVEAVDILLSKLGSDANVCVAAATAALRIACAHGNIALVDHLLLHWRCDAGDHGSSGVGLALAAENGHVDIVERLLVEDDVAASGSLGEAACRAAGAGHLPVLERLLADPRTDPSASFNAAIREASLCGSTGAVRRLLEEPRVDPGAGNQASLALAARRGHVAVIHELLADPRVSVDAFLGSVVKSAGRDHMTLPACYALLSKPSAVRLLLAETTGKDPRFPRAYGSRDVASWGAAAWRRRRHALLGRCITDSDE